MGRRRNKKQWKYLERKTTVRLVYDDLESFNGFAMVANYSRFTVVSVN